MNNAATLAKDDSVYSAVILGQFLDKLPKDLYIPPNALQVFLETFSGPLDLLLYLIKRNNINVLDIPIAQITAQYMEYITLMKNFNLELIADYLVMAAVLAEIKSKMLLPRSNFLEEDEENDPRAELIKKLQEYEQFKRAAEAIDLLPRINREIFCVTADVVKDNISKPLIPKLITQELIEAFRKVSERLRVNAQYSIIKEGLTVQERMTDILSALQQVNLIKFESMFILKEGRRGMVITFVSMLELLRQKLINIIQTEIYGSIYLKLVDEQG